MKIFYNICNQKEKNMEKISGIYKITNTVTGDFYIGSSKDVKQRWRNHKKPSAWKRCPNNQMYLDMQKYGLDKFVFEILAEVEAEELKVAEQQFIEKLKPTYNSNRANGWDIERYKEYNKSDKRKKYQKEYQKSDKGKESQKKYHQSDKYKKYHKEYNNQLCFYNGQTLTLNALSKRFRRKGLSNPVIEAKKYLVH